MTATLAFWIAFASLVFGAVCSTLHLSLRGLSRSRLELLAEQKSRNLRARAGRILEDRTGHAASIALPRVFANILVALAILIWVNKVRGHAASVGFTGGDIVIATIIATPVLWLVGYVLPLSIATHAGERTVLLFSRTIRGMHLALLPVRRVIDVMDEAVRRLAGATASNAQEAIGAELLSVAEMGQAEGRLDESEREMIEGVVSFRTTSVERIMTPRTDIEAIELTDDLEVVLARVQEIGHSRIPVYRESLDGIVGILYVKDLLSFLGGQRRGDAFRLDKVVRKALFVPEQKAVRELLAELVTNKVHLAMVADEYGGTSGLVTIEDIIEEVFGDIFDEYDEAEDEDPTLTVDVVARVAHAEASMRVDEANDGLEAIGVEVPESDEYDTLGGFVITRLGRIPEVGESVELRGGVVRVTQSSPTRVLGVTIEARDAAPAAQAEPSPEQAEGVLRPAQE